MKNPLISIVMGSDSDLSQMKSCADMLEYFKISFEITILSAHRTPEKTMSYSKSLIKRGIQVVIAGAGGAAHLPGVIAAYTTIPVIGVPMETSSLSGIDSLYSIVQMPKGIPVATVAIGKGGAANAAILAAEILALKDTALSKRLLNHKKEIASEVSKKALKLQKVGYKRYGGAV